MFLCLRYANNSHLVTQKSDSVKLLVVGDQSSGKSSLLRGLTGVSFLVASDLCIPFATQIGLRRALVDAAGVKIGTIPGPSAQVNEATKTRLLGFERQLSAAESLFQLCCSLAGLNNSFARHPNQ